MDFCVCVCVCVFVCVCVCAHSARAGMRGKISLLA